MLRLFPLILGALGWLAMGTQGSLAADTVAPASTVTAPVAPLSTEQSDALVAELKLAGQSITESGQVPALGIAVVTSGKVLMAEGFGTTQVQSGTPVTDQTVFRLASVSKTLTAGLLALLVEDRFLNWTTPVEAYMPSGRFKDPHTAANLTLEQLLSHRTGLPHHTFDLRIEANEEFHALVDAFGTVTPKCQPGDCYAYQNVAFSLAGVVAEAATGDFIDVLMTKRLFLPLGMRTASMGRTALIGSDSWARPHIRRRGRWRAVDPLPTYYRLPAAAGVNASPADLAIWLQALLGAYPEVLDANALAEIGETRIDTPTEIRGSSWRGVRLRQAGYGLGVRVFDYAGHRLIFHAGAVQGYRALMGVLPDNDFGVVVIWNSETSLPSGLFPTILDRRLGLTEKQWIKLPKVSQPARAAAR